jgi:hypothetical protein
MKDFIMTYLEDNELGVNKKEILVAGKDFRTCYEEHIQKYPTIIGLVQQTGGIPEGLRNNHSQESQGLIRHSQMQLEKDNDDMFEEEEREREGYDG